MIDKVKLLNLRPRNTVKVNTSLALDTRSILFLLLSSFHLFRCRDDPYHSPSIYIAAQLPSRVLRSTKSSPSLPLPPIHSSLYPSRSCSWSHFVVSYTHAGRAKVRLDICNIQRT